MKIKDGLFILLAAVLMALFAAQICLNLPASNLARLQPRPKVRSQQDLLTTLNQAGLEPIEARYYRKYNE